MDQHTFSLSLAAALVVVVAGISGLALWKRQHYLLGDLSLLLAFSGISFLFYGVYDEPSAYTLSRLCDGAMKGLALPVLVVLGMLAATHRFRPSRRLSAGILWAVLLSGMLLETETSLVEIRTVMRLGVWCALTVFLWYVAARLFLAGEFMHALGVQILAISAQVVAMPSYSVSTELTSGDVSCLIFEAVSASFLCAQLYYAVCALERANVRQTELASSSSIA